jgi:hypothetical protein
MKYSQIFRLRIAPGEHAQLARVATKLERSQSDTVRVLIRQAYHALTGNGGTPNLDADASQSQEVGTQAVTNVMH